MAANRRRTNAYDLPGSAAYAPAYDGSAVRAPRREEELQTQPKRRQKPKTLTRKKVRVREAGQVAPFAVVGFLAVAAFAAMLLLSYVQYTVVSGDVVRLRKQLSALQEQNSTLSAQYEQVFDSATIQQAAGDDAVRPSNDQIVYIDLSEEDQVTVFSETSPAGALSEAVERIADCFSGLIEYFR